MTDVCALATSYAHTVLSFLVNSTSSECPCFSWREVNSYENHKLLLFLCLRDELASTKTDSRYPFSLLLPSLSTLKRNCQIIPLVTWLSGSKLASFQVRRDPQQATWCPFSPFCSYLAFMRKGTIFPWNAYSASLK